MNITPKAMAYFGEMKHGHPILTKLTASRVITSVSLTISSLSLIASVLYASIMSLLVFNRSSGYHYRSNPFMAIWPCATINVILCWGTLMELCVFGGWFQYSFRHATRLKRLERSITGSITRVISLTAIFLLCLGLSVCFMILNGYGSNFELPSVFTWISCTVLSGLWLLLLSIRLFITATRTRQPVVDNLNRLDDDEHLSLAQHNASNFYRSSSASPSSSDSRAFMTRFKYLYYTEDLEDDYEFGSSGPTSSSKTAWTSMCDMAICCCLFRNGLRWIIRFVIWFGIILGLMALLNNAIDRLLLSRHNLPSGKLIKMHHGPKMHLWCQGGTLMNDTTMSNVTLVLETDIGQVSSMNWFLLFPMLSNRTRTCMYDRSGYGWSQLGRFPRTGSVIASELNHLLKQSGELDNKRQIVLAGHGWGAQFIRTYQSMYPDHVAGMIFIDGASDNSTNIDSEVSRAPVKKIIEKQKRQARFYKRLAIFEPFGLTQDKCKYDSFYTSLHEQNNGKCKLMCRSRAGEADMFNNRWSLSVWSEQFNRHQTEKKVHELTSKMTQYLGDMPIGVFTAGASINGTCDFGGRAKILLEMDIIDDYDDYCDEYNQRIKIWGPIYQKEQQRIAQFSSNVNWKIFWDSRSFIQWDQPETLADEMIDVVRKAEHWAREKYLDNLFIAP